MDQKSKSGTEAPNFGDHHQNALDCFSYSGKSFTKLVKIHLQLCEILLTNTKNNSESIKTA